MLPFPTDHFDPDAQGRSLCVKLLDLVLSLGVVLAVAFIAGSAASFHVKAEENETATGCKAPAGWSETVQPSSTFETPR